MDLIEIGEKIGKIDAKLDGYHSTVLKVAGDYAELKKEQDGIRERARGVRGIFGAITGILALVLAWFGTKHD